MKMVPAEEIPAAAATPTEEVMPSGPEIRPGVPVASGGDVTTPSSSDVAALLAEALRVSNAIYNGARNAVHDSPDMNMCSGCEWARLIDRLAAALQESEKDLADSRLIVRETTDKMISYRGDSIEMRERLAASEAEQERLQRHWSDFAGQLRDEAVRDRDADIAYYRSEITRLQAALAKSRERLGTFEALATEAKRHLHKVYRSTTLFNLAAQDITARLGCLAPEPHTEEYR